MNGQAGEWRPLLGPGVVLRHDRVRGCDLLLMPERVVRLTGSAAAVLRLCDGRRTVEDIVAKLLALFGEPALPPAVTHFLERVRDEGWVC